MDVEQILHKTEFKEFYNYSRDIFTPHKNFKYKNCISVNYKDTEIHSVKLYFATFIPYLEKDIRYFDYNKLKSLYSIWDTDNLDNKGLSFCIKYYPSSNQFKYQMHCKAKPAPAFSKLSFSNNNCRYGVGIENEQIKNYINLKDKKDKIEVARLFNMPYLSFFEELEYCELESNVAKVIASYASKDKDKMCVLIKKYTEEKIYKELDNLLNEYNIRARNIGFYSKGNVKSYYLYSQQTDIGVDTYGTFLNKNICWTR